MPKQVFNDIIDILLKKKAALREEIEREFAERSSQIDDLLFMAGYDPVKEVAETIEEVTEVAEYVPEAVAETTEEVTARVGYFSEAVAEAATPRIY